MRTATESQPLTTEPLAHLDETGRPHLPQEHLLQVGERARHFAARFGAGEWARLAGRWHAIAGHHAGLAPTSASLRKEGFSFSAH